jgi:hypothetical protein
MTTLRIYEFDLHPARNSPKTQNEMNLAEAPALSTPDIHLS